MITAMKKSLEPFFPISREREAYTSETTHTVSEESSEESETAMVVEETQPVSIIIEDEIQQLDDDEEYIDVEIVTIHSRKYYKGVDFYKVELRSGEMVIMKGDDLPEDLIEEFQNRRIELIRQGKIKIKI